MNGVSGCQHCGGPLEDGRCPACNGRTLSWFIHREIVALAVLSVAAVLAFFGTRAVAQLDTRIRAQDAATWDRVGHARLAAGDPEGAADAFGHASAMARDNGDYRLALATALSAAERHEAARQVLLGVRSLAPENPEANLRLARLEAGRGDETAAVRYYQNALYGVWREDDAEARGRVRIEFIEYLIDRGQQGRALAELLALERNLVDEPDAHVEAAGLFRRAGDARRALAHYEQALKLDPDSIDASVGAGEAAFSVGDYARAQRHLRAAPDGTPAVAELRAVTALVLSRDPLAPRLAFAERRRRLLLNLADSVEHVAACAAEGEGRARLDALEREARALEASLARRTAAPALETIEAGVDLVYRIQRETAERCGAEGPSQRALLIIGERYQGDPP
jgi:tetratricopeptide (TPR) repeat protein